MELKNVIHLYLGCECVITSSNGRGGISQYNDIVTLDLLLKIRDKYSYIKEIKPLLRPLSSMTEDERNQFNTINSSNDWKEQCEANNTAWLLSKGFDLFGLIESGRAIDKTKK